MNVVGTVFFALMSIIALLGAVVTVASRNPIRSAVGLLGTIVGIAGLFLRLNAEFMAAIQLIVYAGAVVVLFVFVVMLLGPDASAVPPGPPKARISRTLAGVLMAVFAGLTGFFVLGSSHAQTAFRPVGSSHGSVEAVGRELFTKSLVPFELTTALLIVAVVGAIAVARSNAEKRPKPASDKPAAHRLFHGPLHPRDAGHPLSKERA
jgi:NADH-quinone oxidoreductase subunit J